MRATLFIHSDPSSDYDQRITIPTGALIGPTGRANTIPIDNVPVRFIRLSTAGRRHYQTLDPDQFPVDIYI